MAKRRRLEAPSADDLDRFEAEFRRETAPRPSAPIAQVAAEAALQTSSEAADVRLARAKDSADAARFREADAAGLVLTEIPLDQIHADAMIRDRTILDREELDELKISIRANGLRLPIEVFRLPEGSEQPYGLLSGYRRLLAVRGLSEIDPQLFGAIKAIVRDQGSIDSAYTAMVEENEVRSPLTHFERGRIAVVAAQQGAFSNTEEAVERLFASASRAKRSKVRSFATLFEELGDVLNFPESLTERRGLQVAAALRLGAEPRFRDVLDTGQGTTPDSEWELLSAVIEESEGQPKHVRRGGRPKINVPEAGWKGRDTLQTSTGVTMRVESDSQGYVIRLKGKVLDREMVESLMIEMQNLLERK